MKECELCERPARMYCESDQASLCWACDAKVHSANFLVARHTRSLLCRACQAPTPWRAAGARLGPSVSVCQKCVGRCGGRKSSEVVVDSGERTSGRADEIEKAEDEDDYDDDNDDEEDVEGEEDEDDGEDEEEDGENQVVPLTSTSPLSLSGPAASLSSEDESSSHGRGFFGTSTTLMKRRREDEDFLHQERFGCSSSQANYGTSEDGELSSTPSRAPKDRKITSGETEAVTVSRTNLAGTKRSTQNERWNRVERTVGTCSRREGPRSAVHLVSDGSESRPM